MSVAKSPLRLFIAVIFTLVPACATIAEASPIFTDISAGLQGTYYDTAVWGDYDNDGDLDLILSGCTGGMTDTFTRIYRNNVGAGGFTPIDAGLPQLMFGAAAWGDYDGDGDLDLALMGGDADSNPVTNIFRNEGPAGFIDIGAGLAQLYDGSLAWGDYDNDGDLDLLLTGGAGSIRQTKLFRNDDGGVFTDVATALPNVRSGATSWGDYDGDGDLDLLLAGSSEGTPRLAGVFRNDGDAVFTDISAGLTAVGSCAASWGDYDNDGDLDILLAGTGEGNVPVTRVYRNDGGDVFTSAGIGLPDVRIAAGGWGDYDNDGDLDILLSGLLDASVPIARVYRNDGGGIFTDGGAGLDDIAEGSAAWGDYDNDGDLDLVLTGRANYYLYARIYRSEGADANTPPSIPSELDASVYGNHVTFSWHGSVDSQTPFAALCYNLRIGTTPGGSEIMSAMARNANGFRRIVALGNAQRRNLWEIAVPSGTIYWSVQAIDGVFAGSNFAAEHIVSVSAVDELEPAASELLQVDGFTLPGAPAAIRFRLPEAQAVSLRIFDTAGRCVRDLISAAMPAGEHEVYWAGTDQDGARVSSGVYFCQLQAGDRNVARRIVRVE